MDTQQQTSLNVLLIGDSCIDEYHYGIVNRLSPEAPVPILTYTRSEITMGMAGNVYENLCTLGLNVDFITNELKPKKQRYIDQKSGQQLLRVDKDDVVQEWNNSIEGFSPLSKYDAIVISDYNKGFLTYKHIEQLRYEYNGPIFIDTKKHDLQRFNGCIVKVNETEFQNSKSLCYDMIVTLGSVGARYKSRLYETVAVKAFDVCGAGDTFLSALVYEYLYTNGDMDASIRFANMAASVTVQHLGVYAPTIGEINAIAG
jgi:D-beta-D-heptose 7-phosphate kinase/D-beta-D-heptose 1-phosphate adenosyltransferase